MMLSRRTRSEAADRQGNTTDRPRQGYVATARNDGRSVHSLQRALGNQAIQELHRRDEFPRPTADQPVERVEQGAERAEPSTEDTVGVGPAEAVPGEGEAAETTADSDAKGGALADIPAELEAESEPDPGTEFDEPEGAERTEPRAETARPEGTAPGAPDEDPAFQAVVEEIGAVASRTRSHPPPEAASAAAQEAAESPPSEVTSKAAANQVDEMARQEPQPFDRTALKEALIRRIEESAPETLEDADEFADSNELGAVKRELDESVGAEKDRAQEPIEETTREPPDTTGIEPKPTTPLETPEVGSPPSGVGAARAAPKPKPEAEVSTPFQERSRALDRQFEEAGITEEQLENVNEPSFARALEAKREAQAHADRAPAEYRQHEQSTLSNARTEAEAVAGTELQSMHGTRSQLLGTVGGLQEETKREDEQTRAEIAENIQGIYEETKQRVDDRLTRLDREVNETFDEGAEAARERFETYVDERMRAYKEERYSGPVGWARWGKDKLLGMPSEVERFYVEGRDRFLSEMDAVIDRVVDVLETGLRETKAIIADGRERIAGYVAELPDSLRAVGRDAAGTIQRQFDELEGRVEGTKDELIGTLARKYNEKRQAVDARIEELNAENRGLVDQAFDAIGGVIRTIIQLKDLLLGVLSKASSAVGTIIRDPIGFLDKLVTGVRQGLDNFVANIWTHLQTGLLGWLTGAVAATGIRLPDELDLQGVFGIIMQVLGLTYENIREQAVNVLGEGAVSALEETFEFFRVMVTEGITGLWEYVQDRLGDLQERVLDEIRELVITQVIQAGIKWLMSLLGPVGAFIKACHTIYEVVSFFVARARQVLELVDAFLDSVLAVAKGSLGAVAQRIEGALAQSISVLIGFLASLLGLSGLPEKVRGAIETVRAPINQAIQWVIEQAKAAVRRLGTALGIGPKDEVEPGPDERSAEDKQNDLDAARGEVEELLRDSRKSVGDIREALPEIKAAYRLTTLELTTEPQEESTMAVRIKGKINPGFEEEGEAKAVSEDEKPSGPWSATDLTQEIADEFVQESDWERIATERAADLSALDVVIDEVRGRAGEIRGWRFWQTVSISGRQGAERVTGGASYLLDQQQIVRAWHLEMEPEHGEKGDHAELQQFLTAREVPDWLFASNYFCPKCEEMIRAAGGVVVPDARASAKYAHRARYALFTESTELADLLAAARLRQLLDESESGTQD